ncbi:aldo/keto reductase [Schumannella luteola]|uniref:Aryl-alcohol dehydrogenase-like predicted oxidoreductase n=1 Tax=Schumannella luteola TaxID=472059 RepID=A0A852YHF9_9MICO|nr:aldo/keto reductase [Schumannella luteola]NYH00755.1 aryl-alcohol dehydrogenase-like predicted oxidoreductase [Schumannella luteola]TPX03966.1 aldo/keto reductase [Schumannella luteola]
MQHRTLGRTGIKVSPFALGAMSLGGFGTADRDEATRIIHRSLDAGINFVDTADMYADSEEVVGLALKGRRDDVVLATKFHGPMGEDPNRRGNSRRWIMTAVEDSLRKLQTDRIDLYQVHRPDPSVDIDETLSALTDLVRSGKVRAIGTSSFPASQIVEAQWMSERRGFERFRTEQPTYSILNRSIEGEILPLAQKYGMGTLVYSPLGGGQLTGRYRKGQPIETHRSQMPFSYLRDERRLDVIEQLIPVAEQAGLSLTHLALGFVLAHPGVTSAIIGPRTEAQLDDLLAASEVRLDDATLDAIDAIVAPGTDVTRLDMSYQAPEVLDAGLRRRPLAERSAA